jgi:hypothetical protein
MEAIESIEHPGRLAEVGFIPTFKPHEFAIYFEDFPIWVLALEKSFCKRLHVLGWELASQLHFHLKQFGSWMNLANRSFGHVGIGLIEFHETMTPSPGIIVLVSGSPCFLESMASQLMGCLALFLGVEHWKLCQPPWGPAQLWLNHRTFTGDPTILWHCLGLKALSVNPLRPQSNASLAMFLIMDALGFSGVG